jgi:hypothetical protein
MRGGGNPARPPHAAIGLIFFSPTWFPSCAGTTTRFFNCSDAMVLQYLRRKDLCTTGEEIKHLKIRHPGEGRNQIFVHKIKLLGFALSREN